MPTADSEHAEFDDALSPENPGLVIDLVEAVVTDPDPVERALEVSLKEVGYQALEPISLSRLLQHIDQFAQLRKVTEEERYKTHMDAGEKFRSQLKRKDALALLAVSKIQLIRAAVKEGARRSLASYIQH